MSTKVPWFYTLQESKNFIAVKKSAHALFSHKIGNDKKICEFKSWVYYFSPLFQVYSCSDLPFSTDWLRKHVYNQ